MRDRVVTRILALMAVPFLVVAINVLAFGGVASAHVVTSINADCYLVTVHFSDFPEAGVMVHIAVDVNGQSIGSDVVVTSSTSETHVDISPVTAALFAAPAHIDVDVTWTFLGPQHVHQTLTLTCGSTTTTSSTTTTTAAPAPTTTVISPPATTAASTSTTVAETTTSTEVKGVTTIVTTTTSPATTTTNTVRVKGVSASIPTAQPGAATLPRTGSSPTFPAVFGLSAVLAGALLVLRHGRAWSR
jgi:LPXTG-motif cell wall-anchored protein